MDAQCDKLAMVVGGTKLATLATVDVSWRKAENLAKFRVWSNVPEGSTVVTEGTQIALQHSLG